MMDFAGNLYHLYRENKQIVSNTLTTDWKGNEDKVSLLSDLVTH